MLQFKSLQAFPNLSPGVFTKQFGNVSPHWGQTATNLQKISSQLNINPQRIVTVNQIHSHKIVIVTTSQAKPVSADGLLTNQPNVFLLIKTADCVPLFLFDPIHQAVGLIHIGWLGANQGIHTQAVKLMAKHFKSQPGDIIVAVGPAICAHCYTMTDSPSQAKDPRWHKFINRTGPTRHINFKGLVKSELIDLGVKPEHIEDMDICTYEDSRFFSHRRSVTTGEPEGRFASIIGLGK